VPKDEGVMANTGFIGLALGFGYYHSENQFVHFEGTAVAGEQFRTATYGQMSSFYISLSNIHQIKWFKFGYGLSYAILNEWYYRHWVFPLTLFESGVKKRHSSFGFNFPIYLELNERLNIGISYRPTFYRPNLINKFEYEHVISFGLALNIMY
jgi:hypothetical protein